MLPTLGSMLLLIGVLIVLGLWFIIQSGNSSKFEANVIHLELRVEYLTFLP